MTEPTMIERVALLIADEIASPTSNEDQWILDEGFVRKERFMEIARSVIAAMLDPTRRMTGAGRVKVEQYDADDGSSYQTADKVWRAMIDAALTEYQSSIGRGR